MKWLSSFWPIRFKHGMTSSNSNVASAQPPQHVSVHPPEHVLVRAKRATRIRGGLPPRNSSLSKVWWFWCQRALGIKMIWHLRNLQSIFNRFYEIDDILLCIFCVDKRAFIYIYKQTQDVCPPQFWAHMVLEKMVDDFLLTDSFLTEKWFWPKKFFNHIFL